MACIGLSANFTRLRSTVPKYLLKRVYPFRQSVRSNDVHNPTTNPAIGSDGTLYVGSSDNRVYAFGPAPLNYRLYLPVTLK